MSKENTDKKIEKGLYWKLLERFGVQGVSFVLQIILARILVPEQYGILALMIIFTSLANVFVQSGFNTSLIQNKDVTEEDYSSVFWVSLVVALVLYVILFLCAPMIADYYDIPTMIWPFRVLGLIILPGVFQSIQLAKMSREMDFRKMFVGNICATIVSGVVSVAVALRGGGIWALVVQNLLNASLSCIVLFFMINWRPRFICNLKRIKVLFSYGWKILVSVLLDTLFQELQSLVVGKKYDSGTLGYYNRGKHFPQFVMNSVNGSVQSVLLPAMSEHQSNSDKVKELVRNSVRMSSYIVFPMMLGMACVARPIVLILLTERWLPCVPYLQLYCLSYALFPIHSCNLQAINAMGRSDLFLRLEIVKKIYGILVLVVAVFCFSSPIAIAVSAIVTTFISWFVNAHPNKKLLDYSFREQIRDIASSVFMSIVMMIAVMAVGKLIVNVFAELFAQIVVGILLYLLLSILFKPYAFIVLKNRFLEICSSKEDILRE